MCVQVSFDLVSQFHASGFDDWKRRYLDPVRAVVLPASLRENTGQTDVIFNCEFVVGRMRF